MTGDWGLSPSRRPKLCSSRAPAKHQHFSSSKKKRWTKAREGPAPSKTQFFLWTHRLQAPSMTALLNPFFWSLPTLPLAFSPPLSKDGIFLSRSKMTKTNSPQQTSPELSGEDTVCEDVLYCFIFLITEETLIRMWQTSLGQSVRSPATVPDCQPEEKFAFLGGAQDFQSLFHGSNVIDPRKKALYVEFEVKAPKASCFQTCWSASSVRITFSKASQRKRYCWRASRFKAPWMSEIHWWSAKAWATVLLYRHLVEIPAVSAGAKSYIERPCSQLSVQKRVFLPLPTWDFTEMENIAFTCGCAGISRHVQALLESVFANQSHLICKAQPITCRFKIPRPPKFIGWATFSQATRQQPPLKNVSYLVYKVCNIFEVKFSHA